MITLVVSGTIPVVKTIADRIRWVKESGRVASYGKWSKEADIARQYLPSFLRRFKEYESGELAEAPDIGSDVAMKLAHAARVPLGWFLNGTGSPDDREVEILERIHRYPSRQALLNDPRIKGRWSPAAIAAIGTMRLDADEDPGTDWWQEALDRIDAAIRVSIPKLPERGAGPLADLDRPPRMRTAGKK